MEIGFVHPTWPGGDGTGAAYSATQILAGLRDRGHAITAFCQEAPPDGGTPLEGIDLVALDLDGYPYHSATVLNRALRRRLDQFDAFDVVHSYPPSTTPAVAQIGRETSAATVVTLNAYAGVCPKNDLLYRDEAHCTDNTPRKCIECVLRSGGGRGPAERAKRTAGRLGNLRLVRQGLAAVDHMDGFRAPTGHVKDNYANLGFPGDRIQVIPHPLDERFLVDHESDFRQPLSLLYVGYLKPHKGVDKLAPILAGLRERGFEVTLTIVGDGGRRTAVKRQARDLGVEDHIDFRGFVPNDQLPDVYAVHDALVHPGIWEEPLARVYIEALATGTPIVTAEYGDVRTVIGDGGVTTNGSVEDFVDVIEELSGDGRLSELSAGAADAVEQYRKDRIIPEIEALYESICRAPTG